jgi:hypothetical protein
MFLKYFKSAVPSTTLRIYEIASYKINASRICVLNRNIIIIIIIIIIIESSLLRCYTVLLVNIYCCFEGSTIFFNVGIDLPIDIQKDLNLQKHPCKNSTPSNNNNNNNNNNCDDDDNDNNNNNNNGK